VDFGSAGKRGVGKALKEGIDMVANSGRVPAFSFEHEHLLARDIRIREIGLRDLWQALREGYEDYGAKPHSFVFLAFFYFLGAAVVTLLASGEALHYLAFPMVAGLTLIGPIVAVAFFEMSRCREQGLEPRWSTAFRFVHTYSFAPILALSIIMTLLYLGWLYMAEMIYFGTVGAAGPTSAGQFFSLLFFTRTGMALIAYGNLVGFLFAWAALAISVVSFPLALDKPVTAATAITVSVKAVTANASVLAVWGLMVVGLLLLGAVFLLIGLAVTLPILGHATWHLYRRLIDTNRDGLRRPASSI
jgi:uncharacterized membrane protein